MLTETFIRGCGRMTRRMASVSISTSMGHAIVANGSKTDSMATVWRCGQTGLSTRVATYRAGNRARVRSSGPMAATTSERST